MASGEPGDIKNSLNFQMHNMSIIWQCANNEMANARMKLSAPKSKSKPVENPFFE